MLFSTRIGKSANEGDLFTKFFKIYNQIRQQENINIGWELIKSKYFPIDHKVKYCSNPDN